MANPFYQDDNMDKCIIYTYRNILVLNEIHNFCISI